jgi:hypothetical protein
MGRGVVRFLLERTYLGIGLWSVDSDVMGVQDPADLSITTGERLLITERNSKDWWTAESDSGRGLVPAAYVKAL